MTNNPMGIHPQMTVEQLLELRPHAARVFLDRRMACVGCPIAAFETLEEVARLYGENLERFLEALRTCSQPFASNPSADAECR